MAKELPYFQFEPGEYLTGNIQFCSLAAQGLFYNICAVYWQRDCRLTKSQLDRKYSANEDLVNELIKEGLLKVIGEDVAIDFLFRQRFTISKNKGNNSDNGKKGAIKRWGLDGEPIAGPSKNDSQTIAPPLKSDGENIATPSKDDSIKIREDKKREDEIREYNISESEKIKILFLESRDIIESVAKRERINMEQATQLAADFIDEQSKIDFLSKRELGEIRNHFVNWMYKATKVYKEKNSAKKESEVSNVDRMRTIGEEAAQIIKDRLLNNGS